MADKDNKPMSAGIDVDDDELFAELEERLRQQGKIPTIGQGDIPKVSDPRIPWRS